MAQLLENGGLLLDFGMLQLFSLEANSFIDAEFAGELKVIILALNLLVLTPAAVYCCIGEFTLFQGQLQFNGLQFFIFGIPKIAVFLQSVYNVVLEFIGDIQLGAVVPEACLLLGAVASSFDDVFKKQIEMRLENLLADGQTVLIIIAE